MTDKGTLFIKSIDELCKKTNQINTDERPCQSFEKDTTSIACQFLIPSYQRGYRWQKLQVEALLEDLWHFHTEFKDKKEDDWYCLQPLVVKKDIEPNRWIVLDGQQRLTTLFIILKLLGEGTDALYSIEYQTRTNNKDFLENIEKSNNEDNPDFHYMRKALDVSKAWINKKDVKEKPKFADTILQRCKVIWYEIEEENHYDVFTRLNSGKISLSSAELIKALLLAQNSSESISNSEAAQLKQLEMAGEWDRIEQELHKDEFWYFINPDAESERYNAARIDFIFELILRQDKKNDKRNYIDDGDGDFTEEFEKNPYYAFYKFSNYKDNQSKDKIWGGVQNVFRRIKNWYENRELYHYIGYLMNQKQNGNSQKFAILVELLNDENTKDDFRKMLKEKVRGTIIGRTEKLDEFLDNLEYPNNKINDVLLLFNLATVQYQISEQSRYPFNLHVKEGWSLEHIHARNERVPTTEEKSLGHLLELAGYLINNHKFKKMITEDIVTNGQNADKIYKSLVYEFCGINSNIRIENNIIISNPEEKEDAFDYNTSIRNLALLQGYKNSEFNNKLFPEKRKILAQWEGNDADNRYKLPDFIPLCTRLAFFKHYTPRDSNPYAWTKEDGDAYFSVLLKTLEVYVK